MKKLVFYDNKKALIRSFPSDWTELHHSKANDVITILSQDKDNLKAALQRLLALPNHVWKKVEMDKDGMLDDLLNLTEPFIPSPNPIPMIQWFTHRKTEYRLPKPYFDAMGAIEFIVADEYVESYFGTKDPVYLRKLASVLARPVVNGERQAIEKRSDAEALEPLFVDLPDGYQLACWYYFLGCYEFTKSTYHILYDTQDDEIQQVASKAIEHAPDFAWWGTLLAIAKTGVFGTYDRVLRTPMHSIFLYLCEQKKIGLMEKAVSDYFKRKSKVKEL